MRKVLVLLSLLVVVSSVAAVPGIVAGAVTTVSVADVQVTPDQPNPGERFTVRVTLGNDGSASGPVTVTDVYLRRSGTSADLARIEDPGPVQPGGSLTVPLSASFETSGTRTLRLEVRGFGPGGELSLSYPVVVPVRPGGPQLSLATGDAVVGTETAVTVDAVNGEETAVRNVRLTLDAEGATVKNASRIAPSLPAGGAQSYTFRVTPTAQEATLTATLRYTTQAGVPRTLRTPVTLAADDAVRDVALDASLGSGARPPVDVTVTNLGNAPLSNVVVQAAVDGDRLVRRPVPEVPEGETRQVSLNVSGVDEATVDLEATYRTAGVDGSATASVDYRGNPGRIELTGVDVEREGGGDRVGISGSASNVGLSSANGVVVRVLPAEGVTPARPNQEYFVGTVPASDFVSFDLFAVLDDDVERVPVEVTYIVDGERRTRQVDVDVSDLPARDQQSSGSGLPGLPLLLGGGFAVLALVGIVAFAVLRR